MTKQTGGRTALMAAQGVVGNGGEKTTVSSGEDSKVLLNLVRSAFRFNGIIHLAGTEILKHLAERKEIMLEDSDGGEIILRIDDAEQNRLVRFSPFFFLHEAKVLINTEAADDGMLDDTFYFEINHRVGESGIALTISIDQAKALAEVLTAYITAHDSWESLKKTRFGASKNKAS